MSVFHQKNYDIQRKKKAWPKWCEQDWWNTKFLLIFPTPSGTIIWQPSMNKNTFVGALGFREDIVKIRWSPRLMRAILRKRICTHMGWFTNHVYSYRHGNSSILLWTSLWPSLTWTCHHYHTPRNPGGLICPCLKQQACRTCFWLWIPKWPMTWFQLLQPFTGSPCRLVIV